MDYPQLSSILKILYKVVKVKDSLSYGFYHEYPEVVNYDFSPLNKDSF